MEACCRTCAPLLVGDLTGNPPDGGRGRTKSAQAQKPAGLVGRDGIPDDQQSGGDLVLGLLFCHKR